jgi:hypothetical protein
VSGSGAAYESRAINSPDCQGTGLWGGIRITPEMGKKGSYQRLAIDVAKCDASERGQGKLSIGQTRPFEKELFVHVLLRNIQSVTLAARKEGTHQRLEAPKLNRVIIASKTGRNKRCGRRTCAVCGVNCNTALYLISNCILCSGGLSLVKRLNELQAFRTRLNASLYRLFLHRSVGYIDG